MLAVIPNNDQTWIICGGRDFSDVEMFNSAMGDLVQLRGMPERVIQGGSAGADDMAKEWAIRHALEEWTEVADWKAHGRAAGPIRNQAMLEYNPKLVVAFPGGTGTADMVRRSREAGVDIAEIKRP